MTCTDIFGVAGVSTPATRCARLSRMRGKVTLLRQLAGELTTEITMLSDVIADRLAGHRGYQVIQQLPGSRSALAAVSSPRSETCTGSRRPPSCARGPG